MGVYDALTAKIEDRNMAPVMRRKREDARMRESYCAEYFKDDVA